MDRVRVLGAVDEADPQPLALGAAERRAGDAAVVGPGRVLDPGGDLDLLVLGDQGPLAQHPAVRRAASSCRSRSRARSRSGRSRWRAWSTEPLKPSWIAMPSPGLAWLDPWPCAALGGACLLIAAEGAVEPLVRHDLVQRGDRRGGGSAAGDQAAPGELSSGISEILTDQNLDARPTIDQGGGGNHRSSSTASTAPCARRPAHSSARGADPRRRARGGRLPAGPDHQRRRGLEPGSGGYSALLDRKGHMQGDMRVLRWATGRSCARRARGAGRRCSATSACTRSAARSRSRPPRDGR